MAKLSSLTRRKLKYLPEDGGAPLNNEKLACWNWALSGFGPNAVNPDSAFSYVAGYLNQNQLVQQFQQGGRLTRLTNVRNLWTPFQTRTARNVQSNTAFLTAIETIVKVAIEANNLSWTNSTTPYQLCMYYDNYGVDPLDGFIMGPNYTHWWLKIDGGGAGLHSDGIEAFPDSTYITIRRPEYSNNHVYRIHLNSLHATHIRLIDQTLHRVIRANHGNMDHGAWANDNSRTNCSICNSNFTFIKRRHHCRCCGRLVCGKCSPNKRRGVAQVQHPNGKDGTGRQRVCLYCE